MNKDHYVFISIYLEPWDASDTKRGSSQSAVDLVGCPIRRTPDAISNSAAFRAEWAERQAIPNRPPTSARRRSSWRRTDRRWVAAGAQSGLHSEVMAQENDHDVIDGSHHTITLPAGMSHHDVVLLQCDPKKDGQAETTPSMIGNMKGDDVEDERRKEHLVRHAHSHTGQKLFSCDVCGKSFSRKDNVSKHRKTHDAPAAQNNRTPCICEFCGIHFAIRPYYLMHKNKHKDGSCAHANKKQLMEEEEGAIAYEEALAKVDRSTDDFQQELSGVCTLPKARPRSAVRQRSVFVYRGENRSHHYHFGFSPLERTRIPVLCFL
ncbi:unnamed protein product [Nesidiocoris tenuis]|uniref:C2H2-type domain-containing protein n=1 Tax=Nesidiocoris tenuis TaxID=355587 RepID=A0A6H5FXS3_9HEMI|nr:unnamed protein product [Nesidiocoris tenuis]